MTLLDELKQHEGFSGHAYKDSLGVLTIGYGLNIDDGISKKMASMILEWTLAEREDELNQNLHFWESLTRPRQEVFINMAFNLGVFRFMKFKNMLACAADGNIDGVCQEMKNSLWYTQVKSRADYLIEKYRIG